jgi:SAM-dependent methyltransferase
VIWFRKSKSPPAAGAPPAEAVRHGGEAISEWVERFSALVPPTARVLDLACGGGRHARHFAALGCTVVAVDRDPECGTAVAGEPRVQFTCADLEAGPWPFADRAFDAIVVTHYLHRPLLPVLVQHLARDGLLIYETFMVGHERFGKPSNPAFLLRRGELLEAFSAQLEVLAFEQGIVTQPRRACLQRFAGVRTKPARAALLRLDAHR